MSNLNIYVVQLGLGSKLPPVFLALIGVIGPGKPLRSIVGAYPCGRLAAVASHSRHLAFPVSLAIAEFPLNCQAGMIGGETAGAFRNSQWFRLAVLREGQIGGDC
jgi:hypothetical protein